MDSMGPCMGQLHSHMVIRRPLDSSVCCDAFERDRRRFGEGLHKKTVNTDTVLTVDQVNMMTRHKRIRDEQLCRETDTTDNEKFKVKSILAHLSLVVDYACDVDRCTRNASDIRERVCKKLDYSFGRESI